MAGRHPEPLERFLNGTADDADGSGFWNVSDRMLGVDVDGEVWLKPGSTVACRGDLRFARRPTLEATSVTDAIVREAAPLVQASGRGRIYCAFQGARVTAVRLDRQSLVVASSDLLAFDASLAFDLRLVEHGVGIAAGGLVAVTLSGTGTIALATHGEPLALDVTPERPLVTDPRATVAWTTGLVPSLRTDLTWRTLVGHGGGDTFRMFFDGTGVVVVQAAEDPSRLKVSADPLKRLTTLATG